MSAELAGSALFSGRAFIETPQRERNSSKFLLTATMFSAHAMEYRRSVRCKFRCDEDKFEKISLDGGIYDIMVAVVSAEETEAFNLKGDVQQLLPVVLETTCAAALVTYRSIPGAIVIVTGFLQYIDKEAKTFCVQLHQHIEGGTAEDGLTIVVETNTSSAWAGFVQQVPRRHGLVSFSAKLLSFSQGVARVASNDVIVFNGVSDTDNTIAKETRETNETPKPRTKRARKT
ncbi:hypothetical protein EDB83DRAFT_2531680 [Lactarius deliciosus]|nr:hypothetical protein EDB83DRAFT_2531680 [Lactarius deliciosus]